MPQLNRLKVIDDPSSLASLFMRRQQRRANNDAAIFIKNTLFEVPGSLIGEKIEV